MGLKETVHHLKHLIATINHDLDKAGKGNKAAAQRVRTNSIRFAKTAKAYRKESISEGRGAKSKTRKKSSHKKHARKRR